MQIIYKVRVKKDCVQAFQRLVENTLVPEARKLPGCELFSVYKSTEDEAECIFHEIWDSEESVHTYKQSLIAILGEPFPGEEFPAAMNRLIESDEDLV